MNRPNSTGVPTTSTRATTVRLSETELYGTAAMTSDPSEAAMASTRSIEGIPNGGPASRRPLPDAALAAACDRDSSGTSRSAPGDTSVIRPAGSSTCTVTPGATGTGAGSRRALISAATPEAAWRAESSSERVSETRSTLKSSRSKTANVTSRPAAATIVTRARNPRRRHQRAGDPRPGPRTAPVDTASVAPAPV